MISFSVKAGSLKTQEELIFHSEAEGWKKPRSQLKQVGGASSYSDFLSYLSLSCMGAPLIAQLVRNPPAMQETLVWFLGWEDPLEKGMATHSSILAWRIPWTV